LHIEASTGQVIRTANDRTYLRIGDKSKEMLGENLRNLEYAKGSRHYEDEINSYATLEDLDDDLLNSYKEKIGAESIETSQVLRARGFLRQQGDKEYLTNAAVLLFAKNIMQFYSNCRVRFLRIDGREIQVGDKFNIIKDKSIDLPILRIIDEAKNYISDQLRVFITQDIKTGKFIETPEYPEFPWLEGIVNAVAHRDYSMTGCFIKISMYDDRLEIESPGCLPDVVTVNNIRETRFSRNPKISRVLTEFGWARELNEGVKKIFIDMSEGNLEAPMYNDYANTVRLVLKNSIDERTAHRNKAENESINESINEALKSDEKMVLELIREDSRISQKIIVEKTEYSRSKVQRILKTLQEKGILYRQGSRKKGEWIIVEPKEMKL
jgi:ATP-dependent DNA helicase RecG